MTRSSSARYGPRSGGARAASPACTRSTSRRTCCAPSPSAPGIDPAQVDDVIWGCVSQVGEQSWNIARNAVLAAGWPESVPGTTLDRQCGSSQQALHFAAATVLSGQADLVVAGGVESMTRVPMGASVGRRHAVQRPAIRDRYRGVEGFADDAPLPFNQGVGAELIAQRWRLSRTQLDEFALASHEKAAAAQDAGAFDAGAGPGGARRRRQVRRRRGHPPGHLAGEAGRAGHPVPRRRRGHRRVRVPDLRRRRRARGHHLRVGQPARPAPAGPGAHRRGRRRRPGHHAHRARSRPPRRRCAARGWASRRSGCTR